MSSVKRNHNTTNKQVHSPYFSRNIPLVKRSYTAMNKQVYSQYLFTNLA